LSPKQKKNHYIQTKYVLHTERNERVIEKKRKETEEEEVRM
jgi:hypothetical protein